MESKKARRELKAHQEGIMDKVRKGEKVGLQRINKTLHEIIEKIVYHNDGNTLQLDILYK